MKTSFRYRVPTLSSQFTTGGRGFVRYSSAIAFAASQAARHGVVDWPVRRWTPRRFVDLLFMVSPDGKVRMANTSLSKPFVEVSPRIIHGARLVCGTCGFNEFRYIGRTLDHHHYQCLGCGRDYHPSTETGASA